MACEESIESVLESLRCTCHYLIGGIILYIRYLSIIHILFILYSRID